MGIHWFGYTRHARPQGFTFALKGPPAPPTLPPDDQQPAPGASLGRVARFWGPSISIRGVPPGRSACAPSAGSRLRCIPIGGEGAAALGCRLVRRYDAVTYGLALSGRVSTDPPPSVLNPQDHLCFAHGRSAAGNASGTASASSHGAEQPPMDRSVGCHSDVSHLCLEGPDRSRPARRAAGEGLGSDDRDAGSASPARTRPWLAVGANAASARGLVGSST